MPFTASWPCRVLGMASALAAPKTCSQGCTPLSRRSPVALSCTLWTLWSNSTAPETSMAPALNTTVLSPDTP